MKSAYELALERLEAAEPKAKRKLTPEQKERLAATDQKFQAKLAEREIYLKQEIAATAAAGKAEEAEKLREALRRERTRLEEEREEEKERIRRE